MKAKVLLYGASTVALAALLGWSLRRNESTRVTAPIAKVEEAAKSATPDSTPDVREHAALSSYRVFEEPATPEGLPYRGANYRARVGADGLHFEAGGHRLTLRASRIEQGGTSVDLSSGVANAAGWAKAEVDRGSGVSEEFVFENRRAEHIVKVQRPLGEGTLKVKVDVDTNLTGQVKRVPRYEMAWKDTTLEDGGLIFSDAEGKPGLAYHGAVAIDAKGRRHEFVPGWENGQITLELPASFMKDAAYPVLIDPWLELNFSGSGGGISNTGSVSETPALALIGGNSPCVAWADASDGDFDIYFRYWNNFTWVPLGTSASPGGVSANSGRSTNPSIGFINEDGLTWFHPYIAWEDDSSGTVNIYMKVWTGTSWVARANSTTGSGVSKNIGTPCKNPQAVSTTGFVESGNLLVGVIPVIIYEVEGVGITGRWWWPGTDPEEGWYPLPSGPVTNQASATRASAKTDGTGRVVVAWEQSTGVGMDIFVSRSDATFYQMDLNGFPLDATLGLASEWRSVAGGAIGSDNISNTAALSIQASLALDPSGNPWVAWQESVGLEREVYVRRSVGGGAWAGVGGSDTAGGISGTPSLGVSTTSSFPSIGIPSATPAGSIVRPVVAWEEDSSGNTEINVRRLNAAGTAWTQIADEGSATLVAPELAGNSGGVSRTPSFSLVPRVIVAPDGTITVAWRDGASGVFDLLARRYHDNSPTNLSQFATSLGVLTPLTVAGTSSSVDVTFTSVLVAESAAVAPLRLQLEIRPNTTPFNGIPTHESLEVATGNTATVVFTGLPNVNYHWQARSIDSLGRSSPWVPFGGNPNGQIDFRIDSSGAGAGGPNTNQGSSTESKDKCGLTGLEALAFVALAAALRRRRRTA